MQHANTFQPTGAMADQVVQPQHAESPNSKIDMPINGKDILDTPGTRLRSRIISNDETNKPKRSPKKRGSVANRTTTTKKRKSVSLEETKAEQEKRFYEDFGPLLNPETGRLSSQAAAPTTSITKKRKSSAIEQEEVIEVQTASSEMKPAKKRRRVADAAPPTKKRKSEAIEQEDVEEAQAASRDMKPAKKRLRSTSAAASANEPVVSSAAEPDSRDEGEKEKTTSPPPKKRVPAKKRARKASKSASAGGRGPRGTYTTEYVDAHPDENFWHGGQGYWYAGVPEEGASRYTGVRGPQAAAWKKKNAGKK